MSIFVTPVFAENKLTPNVYTFNEYLKKYPFVDASGNGIKIEKRRMLSSSYGKSQKETICRAFGNIADYMNAMVSESEDGSSFRRESQGHIMGYLISKNYQKEIEVIHQTKTRTVIENIKIEYPHGNKVLQCKSKRIRQPGNTIHDSKHISGNINFQNIYFRPSKFCRHYATNFSVK